MLGRDDYGSTKPPLLIGLNVPAATYWNGLGSNPQISYRYIDPVAVRRQVHTPAFGLLRCAGQLHRVPHGQRSGRIASPDRLEYFGSVRSDRRTDTAAVCLCRGGLNR